LIGHHVGGTPPEAAAFNPVASHVS